MMYGLPIRFDLRDPKRAGGERRWTFGYGIGWRDWRPNTPFITFYNWGPEPEPRRGVLAVGVNWSL